MDVANGKERLLRKQIRNRRLGRGLTSPGPLENLRFEAPDHPLNLTAVLVGIWPKKH